MTATRPETLGSRWRLRGLALAATMLAGVGPASAADPVHVRLVDRLDRPHDGYCLDIPGTPSNLRLELPLFAHNCSPAVKPDTGVVFTPDGFLRFPAVSRCVTVAGVRQALPGSPVMLGRCNPNNPFMDISKRQRFTHRKDGRLALAGTSLCLTVGPKSAVTLSDAHRWRPLYVVDCATADPARSIWEFVAPSS